MDHQHGAVRGRRLASPVRLALAIELGGNLDGAWWPRTAALARELPELIDGLSARLGRVVDIGVNWSSLAGTPDLDTLPQAGKANPARVGRQRLMVIAGSAASVRLMVIPCRTSRVLAVMVLRRAAGLPVSIADQDTDAFRTADDIVRAVAGGTPGGLGG